MSIETQEQEVDGLNREEIEATEEEAELIKEIGGLTTEQLSEIFSIEKIEKVIDNRTSVILYLKNKLDLASKKGSGAVEVVAALAALIELKHKQVLDWYDIKDSVVNKTITEESVDLKLAEIHLLEEDVKVQNQVLENKSK